MKGLTRAEKRELKLAEEYYPEIVYVFSSTYQENRRWKLWMSLVEKGLVANEDTRYPKEPCAFRFIPK